MISELSSNNNHLLPDIDYADAFCELLNIISGSVVRKYLADDDFLALCVPFFINGNLQVQKN
ncbi:MAG: hypothetical protein E3K37_17340 [Candidatus Kuenenia sp.]|nr:hypothetical protein [Candidatus Kuenenia hertensis]